MKRARRAQGAEELFEALPAMSVLGGMMQSAPAPAGEWGPVGYCVVYAGGVSAGGRRCRWR